MTVMDIADYQYRNQALKVPAARTGAGASAGGRTGAAGAAAIDKKSELFAQCREFESIFVKMMLKEMRSSVDKSDSLMSGGWAEDIFQDMLDDEYSKSMANNAGFGIAEQLYRELARACKRPFSTLVDHPKRIIADQGAALENMVLVRDTLSRRGIRSFLSFGTLLGAVREKGFIPYDDDVDIGIFADDAARFEAAIPELAAQGLGLAQRWRNGRFYAFERRGEPFLAPSDAEGFLRVLYGRNWRIPIRGCPSRFDLVSYAARLVSDPGKALYFAKRFFRAAAAQLGITGKNGS